MVFTGLLITTASCTVSQSDDAGAIVMMPFTNDELGIRGVMPASMNEQVVLLQQSAPLPLNELISEMLTQVTLEEFPEAIDHYKGKAFIWDLYTFETQILDLGTEQVRVDLALAEEDSVSYFVAMVMLPKEFQTQAPLYQTIFTHALYSLTPLD